MTNCPPNPIPGPAEPPKPGFGGGANASGVCPDIEVVCFDTGPSPLLLLTLIDCDPASPTYQDVLSSDYRDPNNPTTVVVPTGTVVPCPSNATLASQAVTLCGPPPALTQFIRVLVLSAGTVVSTADFDLDGNPIAAVANAIDCVGDIDTVQHVLLDDDGTPFIRRFTMTGGVVISTADFEMDGSTSYAASGSHPLDAEYLILCDDDGAGGFTQFLRHVSSDGTLLRDTQLDTVTPYVVTGTPTVCPGAGQVVQVALCEYDATGNTRIGEFLRTWVYGSNGVPTVGPLDTDLDGSTPYTVGAGSITRNCQNEVDCANDPCLSALDRAVPVDAAVPVPSSFNGLGFTSLQIDNPPTSVGSNVWKLDIFDGGAAGDGLDLVGTNGPSTGRLIDWLTSGPNGDRPPADEIFILRDFIGGPGGAPVGLAPATAAFQAAPVPLIIPGWAVEPLGTGWFYVPTGNFRFVNVIVDLNITNPQLCDLSAVEISPTFFPGVTIQDMLDDLQAMVDAHMSSAAPVVDPNLAFEVGLSAGGVGAAVEIYTFTAGNPVRSDSVVLCQTITSDAVCFTGEDEPLQSITATNPSGQVVFGPLFRRVSDGAFVNPVGLPISCEQAALERYESVCGDCSVAPPANVGVNPAPSDVNPVDFQMGQTNTTPGQIIMRIVEGAGANPVTNLISSIQAWYNAGDERSVFVVRDIDGGAWGGGPLVLPWWAIQSIDFSVPGQLFIQMSPDAADHPDGCVIQDTDIIGVLWTQFVAAQAAQFSAVPHTLVSHSLGDGNEAFDTYRLTTQGGPALRVVSCGDDPAPGRAMCDILGDGSSVDFFRIYTRDGADGTTSVEDVLADGTPYTVLGSAVPGDSLCRFEDSEPCSVQGVCNLAPDSSGTHGFPTVAGTDGIDIAGGNTAGNWTNVNLVSTSNTAWVDDLMTCAQSGQTVLASPFSNGFVGNAGFILHPSGLTNVVQNGPGDWTFDIDHQAVRDYFALNCPQALAQVFDLNGLSQTLDAWLTAAIGQTVIIGFAQFFDMNAGTDYLCNTEGLTQVERRALLTRSCSTTPVVESHRYDLLSGSAVGASAIPWEVIDYDGAGEGSFELRWELATEPGVLADIQAWLQDIQPGDFLFWQTTWGGTPAPISPQPIAWIIGEWMIADARVVGTEVRWSLDISTSPPCPTVYHQNALIDATIDLLNESQIQWRSLAGEFFANPGYLPGPQTFTDFGNGMFINRSILIEDRPAVAVVGDVEVTHKPVDVIPGVFLVAPGTSFDLNLLNATSFTLHFAGAGSNIDGAPIPDGYTMEWSIDGQRGVIRRPGAPFVVSTPAGGSVLIHFTLQGG